VERADLGQDHPGPPALGYEPVRELFAEVAVPVAEELTAEAFLGAWRLMAIDGFESDAPDTRANAAAFGFLRRAPAATAVRRTRRCGWCRIFPVTALQGHYW
jgi:hypothetical protein